MCGRFTQRTTLENLAVEFGVEEINLSFSASYNMAPSQHVLAVVNDGVSQFTLFRWGLIPHWAKDPSIGDKMINARAETITEKKSFRNAFRRSRCLIVADGFYEWKREGKRKTPVYIRLISGRPFGFAGLHESWMSPEYDLIESCTIITTGPNELIKPIHNRMPVIIARESRAAWLDSENQDTDSLRGMLKPYPFREMEAYEVSRFVNSPANNSPKCIEPVEW